MYESGDQAKKGTNQELEFLASMTSEERDLLLGRVHSLYEADDAVSLCDS